MLVVSLILLYLTNKMPPLIGGIVGGSSATGKNISMMPK
ncbi:hypothetical protein P303_05440 [Xylella fastidiosa MUL0034]|nr:hypothetical protein P303_05440 [Xylella fastidiosa MUL0034]